MELKRDYNKIYISGARIKYQISDAKDKVEYMQNNKKEKEVTTKGKETYGRHQKYGKKIVKTI